MLLFGGFLAWAVADRISVKRRPAKEAHDVPAAPPLRGERRDRRSAPDCLVYALFLIGGHRWLTGVSPLG